MTDEKVCPIMSGQVVIPLFSIQAAPTIHGSSSEMCGLNYEMRYIKCIEGDCMFWKEYTPLIDDTNTVHCGRCGLLPLSMR